MKAVKKIDHSTNKPSKGKRTRLYQSIWRWHFYAGIIFAPILIILAITGAIYLFKPYFDPLLNTNLHYVQEGSKELTPPLQLTAVKERYPDAAITSFTNINDPRRATEIGVNQGKVAYTVFVNPYTGKVLGELENDKELMNIIENLHGKLLAGTIGDNIVELSASWAIILLLTGLYLYFPREKQTIREVLRIRTTKGSRIFWRDLHASVGFWMTIVLIMLVLTGLPWACSFGNRLNSFIQKHHLTNAPANMLNGSIVSKKINKEIAKTTWSAENLPVPESVYKNKGMLPIENIINLANNTNVYPGYTINMPEGGKGVYIISTWGWAAGSVKNYVTMDIDQYSGKVLLNYRWKDYSFFDKAIETGIALHEGRYFGVTNLIIDLIACFSLIFIVISGITMWWRRRPQGKIGIPKASEGHKFYLGVLLIAVIGGILMPMVGVSIFVIGLTEYSIRLLKKNMKRSALQ
ncbi:PepSY-associated TM helix domain-containing protein [Heyndrickxia acidicola]|uniref:PepSY domain-containing protein n=1 Tax=Heyndrickxia acidicola TaxID=209389 RepID=A0ABU6MGU6_9BACI|nr:PepSY domain-containing protein [Heyndrickxia acidicola]MED1203617.1 PepSY domain-containing protein [Heyndrickxia acidicola]